MRWIEIFKTSSTVLKHRCPSTRQSHKHALLFVFLWSGSWQGMPGAVAGRKSNSIKMYKALIKTVIDVWRAVDWCLKLKVHCWKAPEKEVSPNNTPLGAVIKKRQETGGDAGEIEIWGPRLILFILRRQMAGRKLIRAWREFEISGGKDGKLIRGRTSAPHKELLSKARSEVPLYT